VSTLLLNAPSDSPVQYGVSFVLALAVHALVIALLWANWTPTQDSRVIVRPNIVKAELLVLEAPQPKAKPQPAPLQKPVVKPQVKPAPPKPAPPKPSPVPVKKPAPVKPAVDSAKLAAERERQRRLDSLAASSFDDALARESESRSEDKEELAAQTFAQGIYQVIVLNWSRPPSARNGMETRLMVELVPTGDVVGVTVVASSGNEAFDRSAEQAVRKAGKFSVPKDSSLFEKYFRRFPVLFKPEDLLR
jgi:colicin import membrane protein